jgi:two-component system, cell cycle sensor histidine kinase and response regulator CckA
MSARDGSLFFEKAPAAIMAVDATTLRMVAANEKALRFLGYSSEPELLRVSLEELIVPEDLHRVVEILLNNSLEAEIQNARFRESGGNLRETDVVISRIGEGRLLLSLQDASARGHLEEQLRQSQKMEALGMLAGGIAHDFNNLLTIISGYSQMIQASLPPGERDRTAIEQVLKACEHAAGLTSQLLAFSRRQPIQPRILDVNHLVDRTAGLLRRLIGEDIDLRIKQDPNTGSIHADPGQIQQMILNLAINARDAMPNGGSLLIQTRAVELGNDYVGHHFGIKPGSYALLEVCDNGTGMSEATRKRVFEPFFTTKAEGKGTGLGLSTVYGIVKQFGGSIDIYSEAGHGSTFRVYLPREEDSIEQESIELSDVPGGKETLLLVEDEEGVRKMVRISLERCGYTVLAAASGPEALEVARLHEGTIDVLITDMVMPRMHGSDLAEKLLVDRPGIAVIFMSGYPGDTFHGKKALDAGASFLQKPFAPITLIAKVREVLDARAQNDTSQGSAR